jgi:predicted SprT family Zn-dependent metalloprotease
MSSVAIMTVIHELVHVEQWDEVTDKTQHGRKFTARMKQLANKGAFNGLW